jgi:TolB protein
MKVSRRQFLIASACCVATSPAHAVSTDPASSAGRLFFTSQGKTGLINADGTGLRYLNFDVPDQATWQPAGFFSDGRRVLLLSMEPRRDGPGKPFADYYHQTPTHLWIYDLDSGVLTEIANQRRMAPFYAPQLLLGDDRLLVQVVRKEGGQIYSMNFDGSDAREFTKPEDGFPYGMSVSPDGKRLAFHLATSAGYQVWTSDLEGGNRTKVAAAAGHLYFAPAWSPNGEWLLFQDCHDADDPGHDWSDVCVSRPDGAELRVLTSGQQMWFAASYGNLEQRGGGSNVPAWTADGAIVFPRKLPDSRVPWAYQRDRPDVDHFNREFLPEEARGGTELVRLDPATGEAQRLTASDPPVWDFRGAPSPDGGAIAFCRAATGGLPSLRVMDAAGRNARELTVGIDGRGAEHPRWLPNRPPA